MSVIVQLDNRGRASLGKLARHDRYLARIDEDGVIILDPFDGATAAESRFAANPALAEQVASALANPNQAVPRRTRPEC